MLERIVNKGSSRRRRRRVVVALYLILTGTIACGFTFLAAPVDENGEISAFIFFSILGLVLAGTTAFYLVSFAIRGSVQHVADKGDDGLDERQRVVRDRAYRSACHVVTGALMSTLLYGQLASQFQLWLPPAGVFQIGLPLVFALTFTLPTAIVAWNEPDPEPEEEDL